MIPSTRRTLTSLTKKSHLEIAKAGNLVVDLLHESESWHRSLTIPKIVYVLKI